MLNEPRAVREIHAIRELIFEETKDMTPEQHTAYFRQAALEMIEKHGLKVKHIAHPLDRKLLNNGRQS